MVGLCASDFFGVCLGRTTSVFFTWLSFFSVGSCFGFVGFLTLDTEDGCSELVELGPP